jgi:hypothetical protein
MAASLIGAGAAGGIVPDGANQTSLLSTPKHLAF